MSLQISTLASSPSLIYENYLTECFTLNSGKASTNFIRSEFGYGTRQRRTQRGYDTYSVRIIVNYYDAEKFKQFWSDLNYGNDKFYTSQVINGDTSVGKTVRFTSGYNIADLGNAMLQITVPIEVIQYGTSLAEQCPLVPNDFLVPRQGLTPC